MLAARDGGVARLLRGDPVLAEATACRERGDQDPAQVRVDLEARYARRAGQQALELVEGVVAARRAGQGAGEGQLQVAAGSGLVQQPPYALLPARDQAGAVVGAA
ncbi:hypothetical protein ENKNEFLB_03394 [Nocardioides aquaticus]|uniref:DUF222 domain-containing protein n=1 Tax=Nocardioides aquaticus TaxID=160826 RepID=A0ABX8EKI9_9ACTN|nr:hypothetical protein ENKNEFLB_03394 [Nocardioides aquaticus]